MTDAPPPRRGRFPRRLARGLALLVYRDVDVHLPASPIPTGPAVAVANHFGGLADGILLVDSLPRMPRVIARDLIWRIPLVGWLATAAGMIPVHRAADGGSTSNDQAFARAYAALHHDDLVLIFPEGVTQDVPHMAKVRTGAARIALGARHDGVVGLQVLPVGIHYENKAGFRSRALVNVGEPIDVDEWARQRPDGVADGADDHRAVDELTDLIDTRLRRAAPDFPDSRVEGALETAAEVVLNDVDPTPVGGMQFGDVALLADRFNRLPEPERGRLIELGVAYEEALARARVTDRAVLSRRHTVHRPGRALLNLLLVLLLLPYAAAGLLVAAVPLLIVLIASRLPIAPAVRATVVPGLALIAFLFEWGLFAFRGTSEGGLEFGLGAVLLFPFAVAALLYVIERGFVLWRRWRDRRRPRAIAELHEPRARLAVAAWAVI